MWEVTSLKSLIVLGQLDLGTGTTTAFFHSLGTCCARKDLFKICWNTGLKLEGNDHRCLQVHDSYLLLPSLFVFVEVLIVYKFETQFLNFMAKIQSIKAIVKASK